MRQCKAARVQSVSSVKAGCRHSREAASAPATRCSKATRSACPKCPHNHWNASRRLAPGLGAPDCPFKNTEYACDEPWAGLSISSSGLVWTPPGRSGSSVFNTRSQATLRSCSVCGGADSSVEVTEQRDQDGGETFRTFQRSGHRGKRPPC